MRASEKTAETLFIRAESDGTTTADTTVTALQENTLLRPETTLDTSTANVAPTMGDAPVSELPAWLLRQYEQTREEYRLNEKTTEETNSVASLLDGVFADIVIKDDNCVEPTAPENPSAQERETPVIETKAMNT